MGTLPGWPWALWRQVHEVQHLIAFPDVDERTKWNLRDLARDFQR